MLNSSLVPKQVDSKSNLKIHLRCLNPADVLCRRRRPVQTLKIHNYSATYCKTRNFHDRKISAKMRRREVCARKIAFFANFLENCKTFLHVNISCFTVDIHGTHWHWKKGTHSVSISRTHGQVF